MTALKGTGKPPGKSLAKNKPWFNQKESYNRALRYIYNRRLGNIGSFRTPWEKVNDAGVNGVEWQSMLVIGGRPGCLSGDTKIYVSRKKNGGGYYYTLKEIYDKYNGKHKISWNKNIPTKMQSYKHDEDMLGLNLVTGVLCSGIKKTYTVLTKSGKEIRATEKHPFLTDLNKGFTKLKDLKPGDFVYVKSKIKKPKGKTKRPYRKELGGPYLYYPNTGNRMINGKIYFRVQEQRAAYDAKINEMDLKDFLKEVSTNPDHNLKMSDTTMEVHHIDENPKNNNPENLELLTKQDHARLHGTKNRRNFGRSEIEKDEVVSITYYGEEMTYDVSMLSPYNNFVANSFVVHNTGKTLIKDQIVREAAVNNPGQTMNILEFSLEMVAKASKVREFCAVLEKPYKYICSAYDEDKLSQTDYDKLKQHSIHATSPKNYPVDIIETPPTCREFENIIDLYMNENSVLEEVVDVKTGKKRTVKKYVNTVITLDHSYLVKKDVDEKTKTDMLYNLGESITKKKRQYPIIFIILSQLGRHVESPERNEQGKYGNYILETDILGGDALLQHADMVIGINRPAMKFIQYYGPDRYLILDDSVLVFHFLKTRTGDTRMSFFKAEFDKMRVVEATTPNTQTKAGGQGLSTI